MRRDRNAGSLNRGSRLRPRASLHLACRALSGHTRLSGRVDLSSSVRIDTGASSLCSGTGDCAGSSLDLSTQGPANAEIPLCERRNCD